MKDFNPNKTQLCITAAASSPKSSTKSSEPVDVESKSRTLKVMRSALAGIPILTPEWMEACLKEGNLVAPSGTMCIRTLQRKKASGTRVDDNDSPTDDNDSPTEKFGVAKFAAAFQKTLSSSNHLLSGVSVMLCGSSSGSGTVKDLKVLLQQAGASIISSVSMASRHLTDMSKDESDLGRLVFLCDDSATNKTCGVSDALVKQVKKLVEDPTTEDEAVMCVHFSWLFDSISCATPLKAAAFEPAAPRSKALWELTKSATHTGSTKNRMESQIY